MGLDIIAHVLGAVGNTHPNKPGRVTVSGHPGDDMPKGTLASVMRQARLKRGKR